MRKKKTNKIDCLVDRFCCVSRKPKRHFGNMSFKVLSRVKLTFSLSLLWIALWSKSNLLLTGPG